MTENKHISEELQQRVETLGARNETLRSAAEAALRLTHQPSHGVDRTRNLSDQERAAIIDCLVSPEQRLEGTYDQVWILGAKTDVMAVAAEKVRRAINAGKLQTRTIVFLAGMRPLEGSVDDERGIVALGGSPEEVLTETDGANLIAQRVFGVSAEEAVVLTDKHPDHVQNSLGKRKIVSFSYETEDRDVIVINGAPVRRFANGVEVEARHTSESVLKEAMVTLQPTGNVMLIVQDPHRVRINHDNAKVAALTGCEATFNTVGIIPPLDRLVDRDLANAFRVVLERHFEDVVEQHGEFEPTLENVLHEVKKCLAAMPPPEQRTDFTPGLELTQYLERYLGEMSERRRDIKTTLFADNPYLQGMITQLLRNLGQGLSSPSAQDQRIEAFSAMVEGGLVYKMVKESELLKEPGNHAECRVFFGSGDRHIQVGEWDEIDHGLLNTDEIVTEYDLARTLAAREVVSGGECFLGGYDLETGEFYPEQACDGEVVLLGFDKDKKPLITVRIDRLYADKDDAKHYISLGPEKSTKLTQAITQYVSGHVLPVGVVTSSLYSPTRTIAAKCSGTGNFVLSYDVAMSDTGSLTQKQVVSEFFVLAQKMSEIEMRIVQNELTL